jgi:prepilin peptidase CpaA
METTHIAVLGIALIACITDVRSRRIPNALTFGAAALGIVFHLVTGGASGTLQGLFGWGVGLAVFFIPFALGGLGGGDVKLVAALGVWLGPVDTIWTALYAGMAGGILALLVALSAGYLRQALSNVWLLLSHWSVMGIRPLHEISLEGSRGPRLAYALPIFVGAVVTIWSRS